MKFIKDGVFYFLFFYVIIILGLLIRQTMVVHETMYKEIKLEPVEKYEKFISESRTRLANYKAQAITQEEHNCLNEVEKAIDASYDMHHANITNFKEARIYLYKKVEDSLPYESIVDTCIIPEEKLKDKYGYYPSKYLIGNRVLIEEYLWETNLLYEVSVDIPSLSTTMLRIIAYPAFDWSKRKYEIDLRGLIINNDINYINRILELVGEKYEIK